MSENVERRRYTRINFNSNVILEQNSEHCEASLLDISLNGLLIKTPEYYRIDVAQPLEVHIELADDAQISMRVSLAHSSSEVLGFRCESIDLDSIAHLRRLVELNLTDKNAAERILAELLQAS